MARIFDVKRIKEELEKEGIINLVSSKRLEKCLEDSEIAVFDNAPDTYLYLKNVNCMSWSNIIEELHNMISHKNEMPTKVNGLIADTLLDKETFDEELIVTPNLYIVVSEISCISEVEVLSDNPFNKYGRFNEHELEENPIIEKDILEMFPNIDNDIINELIIGDAIIFNSNKTFLDWYHSCELRASSYKETYDRLRELDLTKYNYSNIEDLVIDVVLFNQVERKNNYILFSYNGLIRKSESEVSE